jgi:hypothetical protein
MSHYNAFDGTTGDTGNDTFIYSSGDGDDVIDDQATGGSELDTLVLTDILPGQVTLSRVGDGFVLALDGGGSITSTHFLAGWNGTSAGGQGIDQIKFGDGTIWTRTDIAYWAGPGSQEYDGTASNDTIIGSGADQRLSGGNGDDFIDGKAKTATTRSQSRTLQGKQSTHWTAAPARTR